MGWNNDLVDCGSFASGSQSVIKKGSEQILQK